jgi:hypothetical protein
MRFAGAEVVLFVEDVFAVSCYFDVTYVTFGHGGSRPGGTDELFGTYEMVPAGRGRHVKDELWIAADLGRLKWAIPVHGCVVTIATRSCYENQQANRKHLQLSKRVIFSIENRYCGH